MAEKNGTGLDSVSYQNYPCPNGRCSTWLLEGRASEEPLVTQTQQSLSLITSPLQTQHTTVTQVEKSCHQLYCIMLAIHLG